MNIMQNLNIIVPNVLGNVENSLVSFFSDYEGLIMFIYFGKDLSVATETGITFFGNS